MVVLNMEIGMKIVNVILRRNFGKFSSSKRELFKSESNTDHQKKGN